MTNVAITDQFAAASAGLPGAAEVADIRRAALVRFDELSFPNRRIESWRYTDLSGLATRPFSFVAAPPEQAILAAAADAVAQHDLAAGQPRCVFVDGHLAGSLTDTGSTTDLVIDSLSETPDLFFSPAVTAESALAALNTAFASDGVALRIGARLAEPIQLFFIGATPQQASQLRLKIDVAAEAGASIVCHYIDLAGSRDSWLNTVTDIDLGDNSQLAVYRLQSLGDDRIQTSLTRARLARDARLTAAAIEVGGAIVRNELQIDLAGERAHTEVLGLALTDGQQHCDTRIAVEHRAALSTSRQDYRAIADGSSRSVFNGKVTVAKDAQHIDAQQRNDNLLLTTTAEIDTKPELEIYADQVTCSHGATVGELSDEHLFYLRSRGIDTESARAILTRAFAEVIVGQFELDSAEQAARAIVSAAMPGSTPESGAAQE